MSDATHPANDLPLAQLVVSAAATTAACRCCRRWAFYCPSCGRPVLGQVDPDDVLPTVAGAVCDSCGVPALVTIAAFTTPPQPEVPTPASVTASGLNPVEHLSRCLQIRPAARPNQSRQARHAQQRGPKLLPLPATLQDQLHQLVQPGPEGERCTWDEWIPALMSFEGMPKLPSAATIASVYRRLTGRSPATKPPRHVIAVYGGCEVVACLMFLGVNLSGVPMSDGERELAGRLAALLRPYQQEVQ